jgi:hypothetical protein
MSPTCSAAVEASRRWSRVAAEISKWRRQSLTPQDVLLDTETSGLKARQHRLLQRCVGVAAGVDGEGVRVTREVEASSGGSDIDTKSQFLRGGVDEADVAAGVVSRELRLGVGRAAEPVRQAGYGQGHQRLVGA